jgi:hypothetical protein
MRTLFIAASLALAGCATMSDVVPIGDGRYMVGTSVRGGFTSDAEVKASALKRANAYCQERSKQMVLIDSSSSGVQGWTPQNAEVSFRCV